MSIITSAGRTKMFIQNTLDKNTMMYQKNMDQLSTGNRIVSVGDDPIGISKTAELEIVIEANKTASSNIKLGNELVTLAEQSEDLVTENLQRIRDLCVQAANETLTSSDKDSILDEIKKRLAQIDYISETTNFNNHTLLDGSCSGLTLQIGITTGDTLILGDGLINVHASQLGGDIRLDNTVTGSSWTTTDILSYIDKLDLSINQIIESQAYLGGYTNRLEGAFNSTETMNTSLYSSKSVIADTDTAEASANIVRYQILQQASISVLVQTNNVSQMVFSLFNAVR